MDLSRRPAKRPAERFKDRFEAMVAVSSAQQVDMQRHFRVVGERLEKIFGQVAFKVIDDAVDKVDLVHQVRPARKVEAHAREGLRPWAHTTCRSG